MRDTGRSCCYDDKHRTMCFRDLSKFLMDPFDGSTIFLEPRVASVCKTATVYAQTDDVGTMNAGTDAIPQIAKAVQVDRLVEAGILTKEIRIDEAIVNQLIKYLRVNIQENVFLEKLNILHATNKVAFLHKKQLELLQAEEFPVLDIESTDRDMVAVSFGIRNHDSWCSHNAKVILIYDKRTSYILLPCCPTIIRFGSCRTLLIAGQDGVLYYAADGQIRSKIKVHSLCITGLAFLTPQLLVSSSLDGNVSITLWDGYGLKQQHTISVKVADLPRKLRGVNHSEKTTGITSVACYNRTVFIGGETGAIWRIDYPALMVKYVTTEYGGIDVICFLESYLVVATPFSEVKLYSTSGKCITVISTGITSFRCLSTDLILLSNGSIMSVYSIQQRRIIQQQQLPNIAFAVSDGQQQLVTISNDQKAVDIYQILAEVSFLFKDF